MLYHVNRCRMLAAAAAAVSLLVAACAADDQQASAEPAASEPAAQAASQPASCGESDRPRNFPIGSITGNGRPGNVATTGPYKPVLETHAGMKDTTVYRPETLGALKHPVLVWGNGGCSLNGTWFSKFLLEAASHGFLVLADGNPNGTGMRGIEPDGTPLVAKLDWIIEENERPCSPFYQKLDTSKVAVGGQSCGGLMAIGAASDKRWTTVLVNNSGIINQNQKSLLKGLHSPVAYFIGGSSDIAYRNAESDFPLINGVPVFYGNLDVGHMATWSEPNAGEFGRANVQWLKWHLMGDETAKAVFSGPSCALCKEPSKWKVKKKNME